MFHLRRVAQIVLAAVVSTGLAVGTAAAAGPTNATWFVDRDRTQCANADFTSIQAAVNAARPGDLIRVCPDRFSESVVIDKALTLKGDPDAIEALDCFAPTLPGFSTDQQAIVDPAGDGFSIAVRLDADDVVMEGLVIEGASVGIDAGDRFSGHRIDHNLIRSNTLFGLDLGSEGTHPSRVDHNCIRENQYGLVSELDDDSLWNARDLRNARIDRNQTYRNRFGLAGSGPGQRDLVTFEHNASRDDGTVQATALGAGIALQNSRRSAIVDNQITSSVRTISIALGRANYGLEVRSNTVRGGLTGIRFTSPPFFIDVFSDPSSDVLVSENDLRGGTAGIDATPDSLVRSLISANTASENAGNGIILQTGNTDNTVRGNTADHNGIAGITALTGATPNRFEQNSMHGNEGFPNPPLPGADARDFNTPINAWSGNECDTDIPVGMICGVL
jgi:parallel beta-helix repeat protein